MQFTDYRLEARGLTCRRGAAQIFEAASFALAGGGALIVRGANGSGKSSLLRLLGGLARPAAGEIVFSRAGEPYDEIAPYAHYLGHLDALNPSMTVCETLQFHATLLGNAKADITAVLARVGLTALNTAPVRVLSAGQRRRLAFARLLAAARPLWLLDEPSDSLDTQGQALVADIIARHRAGGGIAVIATHDDSSAPGAMQLRLLPVMP